MHDTNRSTRPQHHDAERCSLEKRVGELSRAVLRNVQKRITTTSRQGENGQITPVLPLEETCREIAKQVTMVLGAPAAVYLESGLLDPRASGKPAAYAASPEDDRRYSDVGKWLIDQSGGTHVYEMRTDEGNKYPALLLIERQINEEDSFRRGFLNQIGLDLTIAINNARAHQLSRAKVVDLTRRHRKNEAAKKYAEYRLDDRGNTPAYFTRVPGIKLMDQVISRAKQGERDVSILLVDIDHFKESNDEMGHIRGDLVLTYVGEMIYRQIAHTPPHDDTPYSKLSLMKAFATLGENPDAAKRWDEDLCRTYVRVNQRRSRPLRINDDALDLKANSGRAAESIDPYRAALENWRNKVVSNLFREPGDFLVRYGGDELIVVCYDVGRMKAAEEIAERRLRKSIEDANIPAPFGKRITLSIGVTSMGARDVTAEQLIHEADAAMYQAKNAGKNCVRVAE